MYGFVDTTETATNQGMSIQTVYNGINLDEALTDDEGSFTTLTVAGRGNLNRRINLIDVEGRDGSIETGNTTTDIRTPIIKFKITDETTAGFRDRISRLKNMAQGNRLKLEFTDEEVFYYATLSELEIPEEESNDLVCTLTFICSDPYAYSNIEETEDLTDISTVSNEGNEAVSPIFELTAKKSTTFAMISNAADEYNLIGIPADVDEQVVNDRNLLLDEQGGTLSTWDNTPHILDHNFNEVKGSLTGDGGGIVASEYGSGDKSHGGYLIKELPKSVQDFRIETYYDLSTRRENETFRVELYAIGDDQKILGKLGMIDGNVYQHKRAALIRVGEYKGYGVNYTRYSGNYSFTGWAQPQNMYLRMVRQGNVFKTRIARMVDGVQKNGRNDSIRVDDPDLLRDLKYIGIYIGVYADTREPRQARINNIKVYELNKIVEDTTPYIIHEGDRVVFDHENEEILLNGEDVMAYKDFGADFFRLHSGYNQLTVSPEDTFEAYLRYTNKYK